VEYKFYTLRNGKKPFNQWFDKLRDKIVKTLILNRLARVVAGNFGDYRSLGNDLYELRIHYGSGWRIYFALQRDSVLFLLGGSKAKQEIDIALAKKYWKEFGEKLW